MERRQSMHAGSSNRDRQWHWQTTVNHWHLELQLRPFNLRPWRPFFYFSPRFPNLPPAPPPSPPLPRHAMPAPAPCSPRPHHPSRPTRQDKPLLNLHHHRRRRPPAKRYYCCLLVPPPPAKRPAETHRGAAKPPPRPPGPPHLGEPGQGRFQVRRPGRRNPAARGGAAGGSRLRRRRRSPARRRWQRRADSPLPPPTSPPALPPARAPRLHPQPPDPSWCWRSCCLGKGAATAPKHAGAGVVGVGGGTVGALPPDEDGLTGAPTSPPRRLRGAFSVVSGRKAGPRSMRERVVDGAAKEAARR